MMCIIFTVELEEQWEGNAACQLLFMLMLWLTSIVDNSMQLQHGLGVVDFVTEVDLEAM